MKVYVALSYTGESQCDATTDVDAVFTTKEAARSYIEKKAEYLKDKYMYDYKDTGNSISASCGNWSYDHYFIEVELDPEIKNGK